MVRQEVAFI